jgi:hypothetical protein
MPNLHSNDRLIEARAGAARYAGSLQSSRRKILGQFFTGLPLSRLLAAVALDDDSSTVIDPMAGHGDILDAVAERAARKNTRLERLEGIEIDPPTAEMSRKRLDIWRPLVEYLSIRTGNAFDAGAASAYLTNGYDLVITNPPYVRYQTLAIQNDDVPQLSPDEIRRHLGKIIGSRIAPEELPLWQGIIENYSGLADLSVPAWLLCAALVRPGGVLALVAPATWRSRNYGAVIEYLLATFFNVEFLIEDTQPGWFSDALVRTQLVIARRLTSAQSHTPLLSEPQSNREIMTVKVSPSASGNGSLVGSAFLGADPERSFSSWLHAAHDGRKTEAIGLNVQFDPISEVLDKATAHGHRRSKSLDMPSLFEDSQESLLNLVPPAIRFLFKDILPVNLLLPDKVGLSISQGLRTGCNGFFYVDRLEVTGNTVRVRLSALFNNDELVVPKECCLPVLRRQSEIAGPVDMAKLNGYVLNLSGWVLPEDFATVKSATNSYRRTGIVMPKKMPLDLAKFVRRAADTLYPSGHTPKRISELSAVRTNVRSPENNLPPRFWYMLPPFVRRHRPDAFVPRVNHGTPWVEINDDPPVLVDANFSTIWTESPNWTRHALRVCLNTAWCRACMEVLGTPLGGGALKLEAAQLKRLPLPALSRGELRMLDERGRALTLTETAISESVNRFILSRITGVQESNVTISTLLKGLEQVSDSFCKSRQRNEK